MIGPGERAGRLVLVALFAVLTAVASRVSVPLPPVPLTLQTAVVVLAGSLLGASAGALSQTLFLVMGLAGLPVFAAGGGPAYLLSPTFGYLAAFPAAAWLTGRLLERFQAPGTGRIILAQAAGIALIYLCGLPWLWANLRFIQHREAGFGPLVTAGLLVLLPGEIVKLAVSVPVARRLIPTARHLWTGGASDVGHR
jgi:biotin transport system substrate-specific component